MKVFHNNALEFFTTAEIQYSVIKLKFYVLNILKDLFW